MTERSGSRLKTKWDNRTKCNGQNYLYLENKNWKVPAFEVNKACETTTMVREKKKRSCQEKEGRTYFETETNEVQRGYNGLKQKAPH